MLLGDVCTRACRFCNVKTGRPAPPDPAEPRQVAQAVAALRLAHVVFTSVTRDDLPDQGSLQFADAIRSVHQTSPGTTVEVLTPDFRGDAACIDRVANAEPDLYNHNVETVPRLYPAVRPGAVFHRSVELLRRVKEHHPHLRTKSGLMLGLGEERREVSEVLRELRSAGADAVTLGQYLRPTMRHLPVERYLDPEEFEEFQREALELGFSHVASGPLVRSSFHADRAFEQLKRAEGA
jgi:lipoic acid synthetase